MKPERHPQENDTRKINLNLIITLVVLIILIDSVIRVIKNQSLLDNAAEAGIVSKTVFVEREANLPEWINIYFTDPDSPGYLNEGIDRFVLADIKKAAESIDVASFDLNLPDVVNALAAASRRGVSVRVVYDGENGNLDLENESTQNEMFDAIKVLKAANVGLVNGGRSNGLMHDKFIIVDGKTLFMGSWNLSYNDTYRNNNNLLKITDAQIIKNYQTKFDELFLDQHFGTLAEIEIPSPVLRIGNTRIENYFSPADKVMDKLIKYVNGAEKSVHFMAFTYTDEDLANAMITRAKAGVEVAGVIENRGASQGALVPLYCAGLPVKTDGNKYNMHHKVIVIDGETVITGSFNFTNSADSANDDNVIIIYNRAVAALYEAEYQKLYGEGQLPSVGEINCAK